jgi:hypothetical protein
MYGYLLVTLMIGCILAVVSPSESQEQGSVPNNIKG